MINQQRRSGFLNQALIGEFTGSRINGLNIASRQNNGSDHGHQQQDRGQLEGKQIVREEVLTDAHRGVFADRLRTRCPWCGENNPCEQGEETGADPAGEQSSQTPD